MTDTMKDSQDGDATMQAGDGVLVLKEARARPRFAIMGEFSAGKSTLTNLLVGSESQRTQVTATRLPPVWISYGDEPPHRVDLNDQVMPVDLADPGSIPLETTKYLRSFHKSDALEVCDLIDMPGISDPNMPAEVWERVLGLADGVIWCTHATQAWRQSEAAVWDGVDPAIRARSLLLVTRIDTVKSDRDRLRVVRRLEKETAGLFAGIYPISLTEALAAGEDFDRWEASGADAFARAFFELAEGRRLARAPAAAPAPVAAPDPASPRAAVAALQEVTRVMPKRVTRGPGDAARSQRPDAAPDRPF